MQPRQKNEMLAVNDSVNRWDADTSHGLSAVLTFQQYLSYNVEITC